MVAFHLRDAKNKLSPRKEEKISEGQGVPCPRQGYSPPKERKRAGCGRGVGREKEAYSPPGSAVVEKTDGESGVPVSFS